MIKEKWVFWILLVSFIGCIISILCRTAGYKTVASWDAEPYERVSSVIANLIYAIIISIALGWIF